MEERNGAHLTNSADLGINFKTKSDYFSSEMGFFDGEGYHFRGVEQNRKLSFEYRLTAHLFGNGREHLNPRSDSYANISLTGQFNPDYKNGEDDFQWYAVHGVYNQPQFLLAFIYADSTPSDKVFDGKGWSVNGELRPTKEWSLFARYDRWKDSLQGRKRKEVIGGVAYTYNRHLTFIANLFHIDPDTQGDNDEETRYMVTAEVKW